MRTRKNNGFAKMVHNALSIALDYQHFEMSEFLIFANKYPKCE